MYKGKKILAIIPARGGSKGLPGKNIKKMHGKPLLNWSIDVLKMTSIIDRIFVSTDSEDIANVAKMNGVDIPFLRNEILAKDQSIVIDAVLEAISYFECKGETFDVVALIEPTSPLRTQELIIETICTMIDNNYSSIATFSELEVPLERIWIVEGNRTYTYINGDNAFKGRQQLTKAYKLNGLLYAIDVAELMNMKIPNIITPDVYPIITSRDISTDIDDLLDFEYVEFLISRRNEEKDNSNNRCK